MLASTFGMLILDRFANSSAPLNDSARGSALAISTVLPAIAVAAAAFTSLPEMTWYSRMSTKFVTVPTFEGLSPIAAKAASVGANTVNLPLGSAITEARLAAPSAATRVSKLPLAAATTSIVPEVGSSSVGNSTASTAWMTPLFAWTSGVTTIELLINKSMPAKATPTSSVLAVVTVVPAAAMAAVESISASAIT